MIIRIKSEKVDYLELFVGDILLIIFSEKPKTVSPQNNPNKYRDTGKSTFNCRIGRQYPVNQLKN